MSPGITRSLFIQRGLCAALLLAGLLTGAEARAQGQFQPINGGFFPPPGFLPPFAPVASPPTAAQLQLAAGEMGVLDAFFTGTNLPDGEYIFSDRFRNQLGDWTVTFGNVGLHVGDIPVPIKGANAVDLNGTRSGMIAQNVVTVPGSQYTVSFFATGNWRTSAARNRSLTVHFGDQRAAFTLVPGAAVSVSGWETLTATFTATQARTLLRFRSNDAGMPDGALITGVQVIAVDALPPIPAALNTIPVPLPANLGDFVVDREKAILLGKALFWDMQVGSDGMTACATCHWNAGADLRLTNQVHPGAPGSAFGPANGRQRNLAAEATVGFRGSNSTLTADMFPLRKTQNPDLPGDEPGFPIGNPVVSETQEVIGSQGVVQGIFTDVIAGSAVEPKAAVVSAVHSFGGANARQTTARNAPTTVNAVFFDRLFWDGSAVNTFNGVNPFGDLDQSARVLRAGVGGVLSPVQISLADAALASQAVGPVLSEVEMSWTGREFSQVAKKLFSSQPLALQQVAADDSVLGPWVAVDGGKGLNRDTASYAQLVREAFAPEWWSSQEITADGFTQMEANFSLFWGLSLMMYESTLVSDRAPYDAFANGDVTALSDQAQVGLNIFMNEGRCIVCHHGPEFAGPTVNNLRPVNPPPGAVPELRIELMAMQAGLAWYDFGFYNIGVRPTQEDLGVGAEHPLFGPLSYTRQVQRGDLEIPGLVVGTDDRIAVDGAFKAPTLRNVELTGPFMHHGGLATLEQVVQFYAHGADFFNTNIDDLDPLVQGIPSLQGNVDGTAALVAFLKSLTDERVRYQSAPFDHPELILANGHLLPQNGEPIDNLLVLPATGAQGGTPLQTFDEALVNSTLQPFTGAVVPVDTPVIDIGALAPATTPAAQPGSIAAPAAVAAVAPVAENATAPEVPVAPTAPVVLGRDGQPVTVSPISTGTRN
jgi:cytochrome c peroxidase